MTWRKRCRVCDRKFFFAWSAVLSAGDGTICSWKCLRAWAEETDKLVAQMAEAMTKPLCLKCVEERSTHIHQCFPPPPPCPH